MFFVYILFSEDHDRFYVGHTNSLTRRLTEHNTGKNPSTAPYKPWKLLGSIAKTDRAAAISLEFKIKNLSKKRKWEFIEKHCKDA